MYQKQTQGWWKHWDFFLLDIIGLQLAFFLAEVFVLQLRNYRFHDIYRTESLLLFLCVFVHAFLSDPYKGILRRKAGKEMIRIFYSAVYMGILDVVFLYFIHAAGYLSRYVVGVTWILYVLIIAGGRFLLKRFIAFRHRIADKRSLLLITSSPYISQILGCVLPEDDTFQSAAGVYLSDYSEEMNDGSKGCTICGGLSDALAYANHNWVDEVYLYLPGDSTCEQSLSRDFVNMGIIVHRLLENITQNEIITDQIQIEKSGSNIFMTYAVRAVSLPELMIKRLMDIIGGAIGCILTGILFLIVGPMIYAASPGPVLFSQTRVGRNGKTFRMYKFRSMYPDAESQKEMLQKDNKSPDGMMFKMDNDPRVIGSEKKRRDGSPGGIGNFIRRTSIDEFPQFWNVLKGDMSLVGTRPPTLDEWEKYSPNHRARLAIRPGITGLWQVSGRSDMMDFEEVVRLDMEYIRNWSLLLDLKLLVKTVLVIFRGSGAA